MRETKFDRRRLAGAAGAVAAGLGGAQDAGAAVVYQAVNVPIPPNYAVDIDGDGTAEFDINSFVDANAMDALLKATDYATGAASLRDGVGGLVSNLAAGTEIGPLSGVYSNSGPDGLTGVDGGVPTGNFQVSDGPGFIGVQFPIGGLVHYGYVGYEGTGVENDDTGRVFALAYENVPLTAITAGAVPEPSSLALLAAGAVGVTVYRRRQTK